MSRKAENSIKSVVGVLMTSIIERSKDNGRNPNWNRLKTFRILFGRRFTLLLEFWGVFTEANFI